MNNKKTVLLGASPNPARYAFAAAELLKEKKVQFVPVGIKKGSISGEEILNLRDTPHIEEVDTITLYIGSRNLPEWYDYILSLQPKRIIFNPGTENRELMAMAKEKGITVLSACTLVMLSTGQY